jgi:Rieske 2Fe-2S family protein
VTTKAHPSFTTLPAKYYTDPEIFRREIEAIYFDSWICAGRAEMIEHPGDYFLRDVAGESIIVTRDAASTVRAFYNVCRHRGTRMCTVAEGTFDGRVQCPYHGWTYGLDGRLLGAPHMDAPGFIRDDYPLHEVRTATWDGHLFLHLGRDPQPLSENLGSLPERFAPWRMQELRMYKRVLYDVAANWKLIVGNYNECLHCPMLHPALNKLTDYLGADNEAPSPGYIGGCMGFRPGVETMSIDGKRRREYLPGLGESEKKLVAYYAVYPNLLLSLHPDYMLVHTLWPEAPNRTKVVCEWYFHPREIAQPGFVAGDAIEFWDMTNREDWRISELAQLGIQSRAYTPGPYSDRESLLHSFDEYVLKRLQAPARS